MQVYNPATKNLNVYLIGLYIEHAQLICIGDKLYVLGGCESGERDTFVPVKEVYSIDLTEFKRTQVYKSN